MIDLIGYAGAVLYLVSYALVSAGRVTGTSTAYQVLNLVAAVAVAANALWYGAGPSVLVNVVWFIIGAAALIRARLRPDPDPRQGEAQVALVRSSRPGPNGRRLLFFVGSLLAVFGFGAAVLIAAPRPPAPPTPVNVYTSEWRPYIDPSETDGGPLTGLITDLFIAAGYEPDVEYSSWSDAQRRVAEASALATFPFITTAERRSRFHLSDPVISFDYALFYRREGSVTEESLARWSRGEDDMPPGRLGVVEGYELWPELADAIDITTRFDTADEAFLALAVGEVDLVPEGRLVGQALLLSGELDIDASSIVASNVDEGILAKSTQELRIVVPKNSLGAEVVGDLNAAIDLFRTEGQLATTQAQFDAGSVTAQGTIVETVEVLEARTEDGTSILLPKGARGNVLEWPSNFSDDDRGLPGDEARVKMLSGPSAGRIVYVGTDRFVLVGSP